MSDTRERARELVEEIKAARDPHEEEAAIQHLLSLPETVESAETVETEPVASDDRELFLSLAGHAAGHTTRYLPPALRAASVAVMERVERNRHDRLVPDVMTESGYELWIHEEVKPTARDLYAAPPAAMDREAMQDDIADLLDALKLGTHARPISPHQVMQDIIIPHVKDIMAGGGYLAESEATDE